MIRKQSKERNLENWVVIEYVSEEISNATEKGTHLRKGGMLPFGRAASTELKNRRLLLRSLHCSAGDETVVREVTRSFPFRSGLFVPPEKGASGRVVCGVHCAISSLAAFSWMCFICPLRRFIW